MITLSATYKQTKRLVVSVRGTYQTVLTIDSYWIRIALWGHTTAQWRMTGEVLQRQWLYQVRLESLHFRLA